MARIGDVEDLEAAEVALVDVVVAERQIRVGVRQAAWGIRVEHLIFIDMADEVESFGGDTSVVQSGLEVGPGVSGIRLRVQDRGEREEGNVAERHDEWVEVSVLSMACMRAISTRCPASISVAIPKRSDCCPPPGFANNVATIDR